MAKVTFNIDRCKGCNLCVEACPKKILALSHDELNAKGFHPVEIIDESRCIGCGFCATMCPEAAITVEKEGRAEISAAMEKVLMKGNEAMAEAAIIAGCRFFFGYPITPQTEVAAYMAKRMLEVGGVNLQAESELAAISMVMGASSTGVRVMTSSSSPGISLMGEGISYLAGCDLPALLINVQRAGPGLGGIQPAQSDYFQATRSMAHGDFHIISLAPNSVQEMADLTMKAFDLADQYRMQVMILADAILGQMMEPVILRDAEKKKLPEKTWAVTGTGGRRKKNIINSLYLSVEELDKVNRERFARYKIVEEKETLFEEYMTDDAEIVMAAYGATSRICKNAIATARTKGIKVGLIRPITLWPFPKKAFQKVAQRAKAFLCVEMSMGQMIDDIRLAVGGSKRVAFCGRVGGMVPSPEEILEKLEQLNGGGVNA
ncbi:MAG: 3-methyl-2-oxobutanoate dehydrogenase subunit VorB [Clostridiales bacterium]|jgi:2-oxoglutarate ferredoxin oxidoreductase subunit alpha|nr:3-methyl-2-oxobutanoate dehydrogenase subunit VorB [Clostridiales bacterium]